MAAVLLPSPSARPAPRSFAPAPLAPRVRVPARVPHPTPVAVPRVAPAVYRRRRLVALVGTLVVVFGLVRVAGFLLAGTTPVVPDALVTTGAAPAGGSSAPLAAPPGASASDVVYVVRPGDTLWSIAAALRPGSDPRDVVDALAAQTHGAVIHPGQRIVVADLP